MQKVKLYNDMLQAKFDMDRWIDSGWRIHTCTAIGYMASYLSRERVLVVYEKDE